MVKDSNSKSKEVWEHDNTYTKPTEPGTCTIYVPYKNDFYEPGRYKITFRFLVDGVKDDDPEILRLEVSRRELDENIVLKDVSLTGKDLCSGNGKYCNYVIECCVQSNGGRYEYRAFVNLKLWEANGLTVRFDTVTVSHAATFLDGFL